MHSEQLNYKIKKSLRIIFQEKRLHANLQLSSTWNKYCCDGGPIPQQCALGQALNLFYPFQVLHYTAVITLRTFSILSATNASWWFEDALSRSNIALLREFILTEPRTTRILTEALWAHFDQWEDAFMILLPQLIRTFFLLRKNFTFDTCNWVPDQPRLQANG